MPWWVYFIAGIVIGTIAGTVVVFAVTYRRNGHFMSAWSQGYDRAKKTYSDWNLGWDQGYDSGVDAAMELLGKYAKELKDVNKPTEADNGTSGKEESAQS